MKLTKLAQYAVFACLLIFVVLTSLGNHGAAGVLLTLCCALQMFACQGSTHLKGLSYTMLVAGCVVAGMYFPDTFSILNLDIPSLGIHVEEFKLTKTIMPLLQLIMFGMGTQMTIQDFRGIALQPKGVIIGLLSQFTIMPILGFSLAMCCSLFPNSFEPEILAGIILIGCSPSGMASNVINFIAKANVPLSVTITSCSTLLAPILTPFLLQTLAGQFVEIPVLKTMSEITALVIFPIIAGLIFKLVQTHSWNFGHIAIDIMNYLAAIFFIHVTFAYFGLYTLDAGFLIMGKTMLIYVLAPMLLSKILRDELNRYPVIFEKFLTIVSSMVLCATVLFSVAAGQEKLLVVGFALIFVCFIHNLYGYCLGYGAARLCRLDERSCRTIAIEVGMQNGGLATQIAISLGKLGTVGLAPVIFGAMMNVTGSTLGSYWRGKEVKE